jgi:N-acetylglucosaminyl-diphospho-decaprenol L-rhamnosyltransferase
MSTSGAEPLGHAASASSGATAPTITVSVVSHAQRDLVQDLLFDLARLDRGGLDVIVTLNVGEEPPAIPPRLSLTIVANPTRKGFGANHNAAFRRATGAIFCVLNPDIRFSADPFAALVAELADSRVGVAAPLVVDAAGEPEDSARRFPSAWRLAAKLLGLAPRLDYAIGPESFSPDWVAGMFLALRREAFAAVDGFDERYFLYYEDVDLCRRLRRSGFDVRLVPAARVTHLARRESRRSFRHLRWHVRSVMRYLLSR